MSLRIALLCAGFALASSAASAQNLGIPNPEIGPLLTAASSRLGRNLDWGSATCGPPRYLAGTCVWDLNARVSLTSNTIGPQPAATNIVVRWRQFDRADGEARKLFEQACRALVAGLRTTWPPAKVVKFTSALIGPARTDHEVKADGVAFAFYTWPETLTCEAQPAT